MMRLMSSLVVEKHSQENESEQVASSARKRQAQCVAGREKTKRAAAPKVSSQRCWNSRCKKTSVVLADSSEPYRLVKGETKERRGASCRMVSWEKGDGGWGWRVL